MPRKPKDDCRHLFERNEMEKHNERLIKAMNGERCREVKTPNVTSTDYSDDELEYIFAMRKFVETTGRKFPTFSEHLLVLKSLGYTKG